MTADKKSWRVREATREDAQRISRLFVEAMGMERSLEHHVWKFWDNPFGSPYVMVAEDADRIVGQHALWPTPLRLGGQIVSGAQALDAMTHPDYRGQGMLTVLANASFELASSQGCQAMYGFPNASSYPVYVRRLHWDHTGDVPAYTRLIRPSRHPRFGGVLGPAADFAARLLPRGSAKGMELVWERPSAESLDKLVEEMPIEKGVCRVARSPEWYQWRFARESGHDYEWVSAYRGAELAGAAAWGRDILLDYPRALLSELIGSEEKVIEALTCAVVERVTQMQVSILSAVTSINWTSALRRCGFVRHSAVPFIVRGLTHKPFGVNIHDHSAWRIFGADLDTF